MTDHPVLIPTARGPIGAVVTEPDGPERAALILLPSGGRDGRYGIAGFWTRLARRLADDGIVTLRFDYWREGDSSMTVGAPDGRGVDGRSDADLALLRAAAAWFDERVGDQPLLLAGNCHGARMAIEIAADLPRLAGSFLLVPYLRRPDVRHGWRRRMLEVRRGAARGDDDGADPRLLDPVAVDALRASLARAPSLVVTGEKDPKDVFAFARLAGDVGDRLRVETVPGKALYPGNSPDVQELEEERLLTWVSEVLGPAPSAETRRSGHRLGTEELGAALRRQLGPAPRPTEQPPLVSAIVASHDGADHLRRLIAGLADHTAYPHVELIVVDNGSRDDSVELLAQAKVPFPLSIVANRHNESFSDACNRGAELASGELLLFLNNDVEPFEDHWLDELVACLGDDRVGIAGATLVCPDESQPCGYGVQHRGLRFRDESGLLEPVLHGLGADPLAHGLGEDRDCPAVAGACLLVPARRFEQVGGFARGYLYGVEDIDLALSVRATGGRVVCSGRSVLIHRPGSSRRKIDFATAHDRKLRNRGLLRERWGPRLRREYDLDALAGGGLWTDAGRAPSPRAATAEQARALWVCVRSRRARDETGEAVARALADRGHRCLTLDGDEVDDERGLDCDVAIHVGTAARHVPSPGQLSVLWARTGDPRPVALECRRYDLVAVDDANAARELGADTRLSTVTAVAGDADAVAAATTALAQDRGLPQRIAPDQSARRPAAPPSRSSR